MMKKNWRPLILVFLATAMLSACATQGTVPPRMDVQPIPDGKYKEKVDYLYFILDGSGSMAGAHNGLNKLEVARSVVRNFNATMPDVKTQVGMRSFGHDDKVSKMDSMLAAELAKYTPGSLNNGLGKVSKAGGNSRLDIAMNDVGKELENAGAPIAMVVVSDGKDMGGKPLAAAKALKDAHGDALCIYTVQVGNNPGGGKLLSQLASTTGCGKAVTADSLSNGASMNAFVREVLLSGMADSDGDGVIDSRDKCPNTPRGVKVDSNGCALDSDKDGVPDYMDKCPGTPMGVKVDAKGCPLPMPTKSAEVTKEGTWIYKGIEFEVNKADLRKSSIPVLNEIVDALKAQPNLKIEVQGHTDSTGAHAYNMDLSKRRANSVKAYLVSKGIDAGRMTTKGYGPDKPIDSNKTKDGRARNRRVEVKPM